MYKTCKIDQGTVTLKEIAKHFDLEPDELRWFHNRFCPLEDLIGTDIQPHTSIIYLPVPGEDSGYYKNTRKTKLLLDKNYHLLCPLSFSKKYGIELIISGDKKTKIAYEIEVQKKNKNLIHIFQKDVWVDETLPEFIMEKIASEIGSIFYPLELELYDNGKLKLITNFTEIQNRWKQKRQELASYYKGHFIENLLNNIDQQIEYRGKTQKKILNNFFFAFYFMPLYEEWTEDYSSSFQAGLPMFPKKERVLYEFTLSLNKEISDNQKVVILAKGKCIEESNSDGILLTENNEKTEGSAEFIYKLNAEDNSIFSILGKVDLKQGNYHQKINFKCFEII